MQAHNQTLAVLAAASALTAAALGGSPAPAQSDASDAIARCRALPTEDERFACMEGLVLGMSASPQPSEQAAPEDAAASAPAAPAARDEEVDADESGGGRRWRLPFTGRRDEPTTASTDPAGQALGAELVRERNGESNERTRMTAHVVSYETAYANRLRVELDNGQVWEQHDGVPPWREEQYGAPDEVEIFRSRFGGYRMRLVGKNLTLGVDRVR